MITPPREYMLKFGIVLLIIGCANFLIGFFIEQVIVEYLLFKKLRYRFHSIEKSHKKFLAIENYLRLNSKWPPLSLYNNQENNSPSDDESKGNAGNSGTSKGASTGKDDDDDDNSPMSYAEISIEPIEDEAVMFDRNSSILNSFFDRERQRLASINRKSDEAGSGDENVFDGVQELSIRKKNEQLKREYLELKLTDRAMPVVLANGVNEENMESKIDSEVRPTNSWNTSSS
jgi:hypothetical protein